MTPIFGIFQSNTDKADPTTNLIVGVFAILGLIAIIYSVIKSIRQRRGTYSLPGASGTRPAHFEMPKGPNAQDLWLYRCERCGATDRYFYPPGQDRFGRIKLLCIACMEANNWPSNYPDTMRPTQNLGLRHLSRTIKYHDGAANRWHEGDPR